MHLYKFHSDVLKMLHFTPCHNTTTRKTCSKYAVIREYFFYIYVYILYIFMYIWLHVLFVKLSRDHPLHSFVYEYLRIGIEARKEMLQETLQIMIVHG